MGGLRATLAVTHFTRLCVSSLCLLFEWFLSLLRGNRPPTVDSDRDCNLRQPFDSVSWCTSMPRAAQTISTTFDCLNKTEWHGEGYRMQLKWCARAFFRVHWPQFDVLASYFCNCADAIVVAFAPMSLDASSNRAIVPIGYRSFRLFDFLWWNSLRWSSIRWYLPLPCDSYLVFSLTQVPVVRLVVRWIQLVLDAMSSLLDVVAKSHPNSMTSSSFRWLAMPMHAQYLQHLSIWLEHFHCDQFAIRRSQTSNRI